MYEEHWRWAGCLGFVQEQSAIGLASTIRIIYACKLDSIDQAEVDCAVHIKEGVWLVLTSFLWTVEPYCLGCTNIEDHSACVGLVIRLLLLLVHKWCNCLCLPIRVFGEFLHLSSSVSWSFLILKLFRFEDGMSIFSRFCRSFDPLETWSVRRYVISRNLGASCSHMRS